MATKERPRTRVKVVPRAQMLKERQAKLRKFERLYEMSSEKRTATSTTIAYMTRRREKKSCTNWNISAATCKLHCSYFASTDFEVIMSNTDAEIILELAKEKGALMFGEFQLSAGGTSSYYFDGRIVTLDPKGAHHIARAFLPVARGSGATAIAGPTLGADPIVAAVSVMSYQDDGAPMPGLIVRKETKGHGGKRAIEGPLVPGSRVAVVDDACSTGSGLFHAIEAVEEAGCEVVKVLTIIDRHQGGSDELRRRGYDFYALLEADAEGNVRPTLQS